MRSINILKGNPIGNIRNCYLMAAVQTEGDIIRSLIKAGKLTQVLAELNTEILSSPRASGSENPEDEPQRRQVRQCAKIWTALGKLIRSQCNKGRIIDSLYFGSFGKETVARGRQDDPNGHYIYCPGPKSIFTLIENSDNFAEIDPYVSLTFD